MPTLNNDPAAARRWDEHSLMHSRRAAETRGVVQRMHWLAKDVAELLAASWREDLDAKLREEAQPVLLSLYTNTVNLISHFSGVAAQVATIDAARKGTESCA